MLEMTDIEKTIYLIFANFRDQVYILRHLKPSSERALMVVSFCRRVRESKKLLESLEERCLESVCRSGDDSVMMSYHLSKMNHDLSLAFPDSVSMQETAKNSHLEYCAWRDTVAESVIVRERRVQSGFAALKGQVDNLLNEAIKL